MLGLGLDYGLGFSSDIRLRQDSQLRVSHLATTIRLSARAQCPGTGTRYKAVHIRSQTLQCPGTTSRGRARSWAPCRVSTRYGVQTSAWARALGTGTHG